MRHDSSHSHDFKPTEFGSPGLDELDRYLAGEMTAADRAAVEAAVQDNVRVAAVLQAFHDTTSPAVVRADDASSAWTRDQDKVFAKGMAGKPSSRRPQRRGAPSAAYAVAATLVAVVCFVVSGTWPSTGWPWVASVPANFVYVYQTAHGERAHVVFPDGSSAELAPGSRMQYATGMGQERRIVLEGQALFRVISDQIRPFVVRTGGVQTQVLGTEFDVRWYAQDSAVQVAVVTGKVSSTIGTQSVLLGAGMIAVFADSTIVTNEPGRQGDVRSVVGWTDGKLSFRNMPVSAVFDAFGRWSGYTFKIADTAVAKRRITTVLRVDDPTEAIRMLRELLDVSMVFDGNVITVRPMAAPTGPGGSMRPIHTNDPIDVTPPLTEVGK